MRDAFVSLERHLRPEIPATKPIERGTPSGEPVSTLGEIKRFRAALADAFDVVREALLRRFSEEILGRELQLAPCDVERIARDVLECLVEEAPLRVRVHPDDAPNVSVLEVPVHRDGGLRRGDVIVEVRAGTIDASLSARMEHVMSSVA